MSAGKWWRSNSDPDSNVHKFEKKKEEIVVQGQVLTLAHDTALTLWIQSFIDSSGKDNKVNTYIVNDRPQVSLSKIWLYIYTHWQNQKYQ